MPSLELFDSKTLRQHMRQQRRALTPAQQEAAANKLAKQLTVHQPKQCQRVALYLANDGEIDPTPFIHRCWQQDIAVYLPVLHPFSRGNLLFLHYETTTPMLLNKYGIHEPKLDVTKVVPAKALDVIYTPLVAFDSHGNRMGMGGGYYDRTLAANPHIATIGIAHDCQQVDKLQVQPWDMPLQQIITPTQVITPLNSAKKEV